MGGDGEDAGRSCVGIVNRAGWRWFEIYVVTVKERKISVFLGKLFAREDAFPECPFMMVWAVV